MAMPRPGNLMARAFARTVGRSSEERLRKLMSGRARRPLLGAIFRQMPRRFIPAQAQGVDTVVDWKIRGGPGDRTDHYQLIIKDQKCKRARRPTESATATLELDGVDFLRLAAGLAQGPELFMSGRLKIDGDLMQTARLASLFRVPAPRRGVG